jgi:hypothetical protein
MLTIMRMKITFTNKKHPNPQSRRAHKDRRVLHTVVIVRLNELDHHKRENRKDDKTTPTTAPLR